MAVDVTIYPQTITWNAITWSKSMEGGPLALRYTHAGRTIEDRTGDAEYPMFVAVVDTGLNVTVSLREMKQLLTLGAKSDMVVTLEGKGGATSTLTLKGLVLHLISGSQDRAVPGGVELAFVYESTDGTTVPVS